jgi:hypothetical protein
MQMMAIMEIAINLRTEDGKLRYCSIFRSYSLKKEE